MGDSDDREPGAEWTGRRVTMSSPIKHRAGLSALVLLSASVANLIGSAGYVIYSPGNWALAALLGMNAAYFALIAYIVRVHDRTWGSSPFDTSRKGGRDS